jgi:hypothetical protein
MRHIIKQNKPKANILETIIIIVKRTDNIRRQPFQKKTFQVFHFQQKKFYFWFSELVIQVDHFRYDKYKKTDIDLVHHQIDINDNNDLLQKENQFKKKLIDSI